MSNSESMPEAEVTQSSEQNAQSEEIANSQSNSNDESVSMEEFTAIKQRNDELLSKMADLETMVKRQQAEFENYRKRTIKEREDYQKYAIIPVIQDFLNVMDNFDRALKVDVSEENKDFVEGFNMINKQLLDLFAQHNVVEIDGVGHIFDPSMHQAIQFEEKDEQTVETVAEIYQKGYKLYDRIIRSATVKVYKPSLANEKSDETNDLETSDKDESNLEKKDKNL